jgi:prephenate dehydrogenase
MKFSKIAIIGFGRFGQLLTEVLLEHTDCQVIVVSHHQHSITHPRLDFVNMNSISSADLVIPCVPISSFTEVIKEISPLIKPNSLVMDVCSVKVHPAQVMEKFLPTSAEIIASHPLFGPDTVKENKGLKDLKIMVANVRCSQETFRQIKLLCKQLQLQIIEMTPKEHDQFAAQSHVYSFLVGKLSQQLNMKATPIDTLGFKLLRHQKRIVSNDSHQLFNDVLSFNPFAKDLIHQFQDQANYLTSDIITTTNIINIQ